MVMEEKLEVEERMSAGMGVEVSLDGTWPSSRMFALEKKEDLDKESGRWAGRGRLLMACVVDVDVRDFLGVLDFD